MYEGLLAFRIADLTRDGYQQPKDKAVGGKIRAQQPQLVELLIERWLANVARYGL